MKLEKGIKGRPYTGKVEWMEEGGAGKHKSLDAIDVSSPHGLAANHRMEADAARPSEGEGRETE